MTQNQIKCIHCDKWVDKHLCHVSHICPYCGARMDIPPKPAPANVDLYDEDDRDTDEPDVVGVVAAVVAETVFDDQTNDPYTGDDDPSFGGGGGSFGGGGTDDSW